jgi:hypothetical protein
MEFSLPEFPATPMAQAAFAAAALAALFGLVYLCFPQTIGRISGLQSGRDGAIGELRPAGGFLAGFAIATLMLDQPILYAALGLALGVGAFGRVLSLMSDQAVSLANVAMLLLQALMAGALATRIPEAFAEAGVFLWPTDAQTQLSAYAYAGLATAGLVIMFMPRVSVRIAGLAFSRQAGHGPVRSAGGVLFALGLLGVYISGLTESLYVAHLFLVMAMAAALIVSIAGRLAAFVINRGNYLYSFIILLLFTLEGAVFASGLAGMI